MAIACVDTKSQAFQNKARELGISEGQLENILHEYINSSELQSQYTEDQFISSKTEGLPNTQASDLMVEAWEKAYSQPRTFDNINDFNLAKAQAVRIFGEESVGHKETPNGEHILTVAEPFNADAYQKEIDSIKEKAIADGTFMKAPNGNQSNLNEQQWLQVRTKAFKRWFGDWENDPTSASKVVDENGEPLVVYHGTDSYGFNTFNPEKSDDKTSLFFSSSKYIASTYTHFKNVDNERILNLLDSDEIVEAIENDNYGVVKRVIESLVDFNYHNPDISFAANAVLEGLYDWLNTLKSQDNPSLDEIQKVQSEIDQLESELRDESYEYRPYSFVVKGNQISIINDVERDKSHIVENGVIFRGTKEELARAIKQKTAIYEVFLNIRDPFIADNQTNEFGARNFWNTLDTKWGSNTRTVSKNAKESGNDGVLFKDIIDYGPTEGITSLNPTTDEDVIYQTLHEGEDSFVGDNIYSANIYIAFNPNQIKSATENRGTFSTRDDNIYFNRQAVSLAQRLNDANIIHKLNGKYYLSIKGEENGVQRRKQELQDFLDRNNYRDIVVDFMHTGRAVEVKFNTPAEHNDLITREVDRNMSSIKSVMSFLEEKVPAIKGHVHYNTTISEAEKLIGRKLLPEETSFVHRNQVYLIKGRATREGSIEEVLHIITNTLAADNRALANNLYKEAKQLFPQLAREIEVSYKDFNKRDRSLELLTQALSRIFRQEYDTTAPKQRVKVESFLKKFIDWIRNLFGFRTNPRTGNKIIELESLPKVMSLKDFATLINSADGEFSTGERDIVQFNRASIQEQDRPYITERMVVAGTSKSVTGIAELMKEIENASNIQGSGVPVSIPYSSWKSLDMPYNGAKDAQTLLGTLAVMAHDWNNERFDYNKRDKTISVPRYWYEVAKLLNKNKEIIRALEELNNLFPEDFSENMSDSDFSIIDGYDSGDYGALELLFSLPSDLDAFVNAGMISFSYTDSRQGELFDNAGNVLERQTQQESQVLQPIRKENRAFFNRQALLRRKADALYDNEVGLTTTEVDEEAGLLANWISDQITEVQLHPENYYEIFGKPKTNEWATDEDRNKDIDAVKSMSRRDITSNIGIQNLIDKYKEQIFDDNEAIDDLSGRERSKAMLLSENLDVLFELGRAVFSDSEGYSIKHNDELNTYETTDIENQTAEENPDDGAVVSEEQGNLEDWMVDKTTVEILGNASALIRSALGKLYKRDENGEIVTDYLGRRLRVSQNDAVKSIVRWIQGSRNVDDMVRKMETKAKENPWIQPIIDRLNDKSGNETDFISQFNTVFDKHFRLFDVIKKNKDTKKNYAMEVNSHPAVSDALNYVSTMFTIGEAPLFTSRGINSANLAQWETLTERLRTNKEVTEEQFDKYKDGYVTRLLGLAHLLGYPITKETVQKSLNYNNFKDAIDAASSILINLKAERDNADYQPYTYKEKGNYITGYVRNLLTVLVDSVEDVTENSFYENGKMRQSYQIPSYASKLFQKLTGDKESFEKTLEEEFGKYEWFKYGDGTWRLPWIQELAKMDEKTRKKVLVHKVNLNFQGDQYMRGLSPEKYALSVLTEFANGDEVGTAIRTAFYGFPMQSNKASSDFLSFYRYTGDTAKPIILNKMIHIFNQEMSRIQTVRERNRKPGDADYIEGFDERGKQFCLLDFLNDPNALVRENGLITQAQANELKELIESKLTREKVNEMRLNRLVRQAVEESFNQRYEQFLNQCRSLGLMDAIRNIEGVIAGVSKVPPQQQVEQFIENFVWNDALAKINIIELLVTDPAYYKNDDDFQKRFAQVHSPGIRGYADATDYNGNRVSDGYLRAVVLKDGIIDGKALKNNIIENLSVILDRDIEKASEDTKAAAIDLKESILDRMIGINITDGQALSALTATKKKGFLFGTWSKKAERVYERLRNGEYNIEDLETAFNVKKPFVYTQLSQSVHSEGTPLQTLKVPTQLKDSEYLLVMAAAMLERAETGKPNLLKVLYDFAEETAYDNTDDGQIYNRKGIDIFVFESGVKSGLTGISDITEDWANGNYEGSTPEAMEANLLDKLRKSIYALDENGNIMQDADGNRMYNDVIVKSIPVEDYAIQNEVPLHMRDHTQIWGSQMRAILESNLAYADYEGNPVQFTYTDSKGVTHTIGREEFIQQYESVAKAVADEAVKSIREDLGLDSGNIVDQRVAIAKELQREIMNNPGRYGNDILLACTVDEYGNFRIPPGDPIQSKRIEQLVNSIVKNRLNKPKVPGGLGVQVSNFGTSRRLNIRFFEKDGKTLLPTRDEWLSKNPDKTIEDYIEYCKENQGGYAYEENYAPAHTKAFFNLFTGRDGNIDLEAIEMLDENLLYSIDQRTPTEFYYSIAIAKTVGFMPKEAGDGFMRPYEITEKDDSDFDVDKETKWKKSFNIRRNKEKITNKQLKYAVPELENIQLTEEEKQEVVSVVENRLSWSGLSKERYENVREKQITKELEKARQRKIYGLIRDFMGSDIFSSSEGKPAIWKALKQAYIKLQYYVEYPTDGINASLNDAWEMSKAVLQHESNAGKILSPGGPAAITRRGYLIGALKTGRYTEEELNAMSTKELGNIAKSNNMNLVWFTNQLEYYKRNNDASSNLGIFAVANTAHSILEGQGYGVLNEEEFTIAGKKFGTEVYLDNTYDDNGIAISKTLGGNVGAAADAAKTPSHAFMNVNGNTINEFIFLLRAGMNLDDATLFIAAKPIEDLIQKYNAANVTGYKPLDALLNEEIQKIVRDNNIKEDSKVYTEQLSHDEIVWAVMGKASPEITLKTLLMFQRVKNLTPGMRALTFATRYNSVASAVGPQIVDNLIHEHQVNNYADKNKVTTIKSTTKYENARDNNKEVKFGDVIEDGNGNKTVFTPDNLETLKEQGIISVTLGYRKVTINDILNAHPMLAGFAQGYGLASDIFRILRMPANSDEFRGILDSDSVVSEFLYKDEKVLSAFSDFYQSYLLVQNNALRAESSQEDGIEYFVRKFPKEFLIKKKEFEGNLLIDAVRPEVRNGIVTLKVNTTGLKNHDKAKLQAAWNQLYKQDANFAIKLFKYNFWKGGIGFSPKTFMNLLPIQMKENIDGYIDTYRNMPSVNSRLVIDQFFLNNAGNNRIVKTVDSIDGAITIGESYQFSEEKFDSFKDLPFFKWKDQGGNFHIFKQTSRKNKQNIVTFVEVEALGNGGEFLEMNKNTIETPLMKAQEFEEDDFNTDTEGTPERISQPVTRTPEQIEAEIEDVLNYLKNSEGEYLSGVKPNEMRTFLREVKTGKRNIDTSVWKRSLKTRFEENGIKYDETMIENIVKKFC